MCRAPEIERTEFYVWLAEPLSPRAKDNAELIAQIKQYWLESGCVYGYRNITKDMREGDFACSGKLRLPQRVATSATQGSRAGCLVQWLPTRSIVSLRSTLRTRSG